MKLSVLSQSQAMFYKPTGKKNAIIRIADKVDHLPVLNFNYSCGLSMGFYDIRSLNSPVNWNRFSREQAKLIHGFFVQIVDESYDELVVHCQAGASRSPAIAIAFGWFLENEDMVNNILSMPVSPNIHVLKVMANELGIYQEKKQWIRNLEKDVDVMMQGDVEF